ncbi:MAG: hypothetical protein K2K92_01465, partial [Duncaniella sp.]|nr:hypothetical protein [Duncaniella sp.]
LLTASAVALSIVGLPSLLPLIVAAVVFLVTCITLMVTWKRTSRSLWSRNLLFTVPWFMWIHPLYTLVYKMRGISKRGSNLTWG